MAGDSNKLNPANTNPNRADIAMGLQATAPEGEKNTPGIKADELADAPQEQIRQKGFKSIGSYLRSKKGKPNAVTSFDKSENELFGEFKPRFHTIQDLAKNNPLLALSCMSLETLQKDGWGLNSTSRTTDTSFKPQAAPPAQPRVTNSNTVAPMAQNKDPGSPGKMPMGAPAPMITTKGEMDGKKKRVR